MENLREALEQAFEKDETAQANQPAAETSAPESEPQPRDEQGKYTNTQQEQNPPLEQTLPEQPEIKAPSSWKTEAKQAYIKAERGEALTPQEIKVLTAEANRRESDFLKGIEEFKGHAHRARAFEQAIAPYAQNIQQLGLDAPQAIQRLLHADHTLRHSDPSTKAQYLQSLAQEYGVDLNLAQQPQNIDPQTQYLMNQLNELRQTQQMWQNSLQQQEQTKANHELAQFATADREHFDAVRNDMADLLETGKAQSLQDAYEMSIWMRPDIRQTLIERQQTEARRQQEEQARNQRARAASVSVRGSSPTSSGSQTVAGSLRDILEAQFDK